MKYYSINILDVIYRVKNEITNNLPTRFQNVCVEMNEQELCESNMSKFMFLFRQAAGMFILNNTGYTPENFQVKINPIV